MQPLVLQKSRFEELARRRSRRDAAARPDMVVVMERVSMCGCGSFRPRVSRTSAVLPGVAVLFGRSTAVNRGRSGVAGSGIAGASWLMLRPAILDGAAARMALTAGSVNCLPPWRGVDRRRVKAPPPSRLRLRNRPFITCWLQIPA